MTFENKVFVGGIVTLLICALMIMGDIATNNTVLLVAGAWFLWLSFHNRITLAIACSVLIGLLGAVLLGMGLGLLLGVACLMAFWFALT